MSLLSRIPAQHGRAELTSVRLARVCVARLAPAAAVEQLPEMRSSSVPPMMKLKDKLYRKNEKLYKSFGMFDLNKVGSVTVDEFARTVNDLNVSSPPHNAVSVRLSRVLCAYQGHSSRPRQLHLTKRQSLADWSFKGDGRGACEGGRLREEWRHYILRIRQ